MAVSKVSAQEQLRAVAALRSNAATASTTAATTRQPDAVSISDAARSIASARAAVVAATDVREDRISALKAAIADGSYTVDSRALASSMAKAFTR